MSDEAIRAVLGGRLRVEKNLLTPELALFDAIMESRGIADLAFTRHVRELIEVVSVIRIINRKDAMAAAYATRSRYVPLTLSEALKELLKRPWAFYNGNAGLCKS